MALIVFPLLRSEILNTSLSAGQFAISEVYYECKAKLLIPFFYVFLTYRLLHLYGLLFTDLLLSCFPDVEDLIASEGGPEQQPFLAALNVTEIEVRKAYQSMMPNQACQLNQNPSAGHGMGSTDLWLHTLIHNCGLILVQTE